MNNRSLSVMSTLGILGPLKERIGPAFEAQSGHRLAMIYDPTTVLLQTIAAGRRADVIVAIDAALDALAGDRTLLPDSRVVVARTAVGLAKRAGTEAIDVSTPDAFVNALLAAKSIVYSQSGASGIFFKSLVERLGISREIDRKAIVIPKGFTAELLISGEAELAVQQMSELMAVAGADIVGPFPEPYGAYTHFAAAVFTQTDQPELAHRFLDHLTGEPAAEAFLAAGLEPLGRLGSARHSGSSPGGSDGWRA